MQAISDVLSTKDYTKSQLIKIGHEASRRYRNEYGSFPIKDEREIYGREMLVNLYPEEIIEEAVQTVMSKKRRRGVQGPPLVLVKGVHFIEDVFPGDNIEVTRLPGDEAFVFRII